MWSDEHTKRIQAEREKDEKSWRKKSQRSLIRRATEFAQKWFRMKKRKTGAIVENINLDFFTTASEEKFGEQEKPLCARLSTPSPPGIFFFPPSCIS